MVNRSLRTKTTAQIFKHLETTLGVYSKADILDIKRRLGESYQPSTHIQTFTAEKRHLLEELRTAGQPLAESDSVDILQNCFGAEMQPCWTKFVTDHPRLQRQTAERLLSAIEKYVEDILPLTATKAHLGLQAVSTMFPPVPTIRSDLPKFEAWEDFQSKMAIYQVHMAAFNPHQSAQDVTNDLREENVSLKAQVHLLKAAQAKQDRNTKKGGPAISEFPTLPFCWTHGPCQHTSKECYAHRRATGHKDTATWSKQQGSQWRKTFEAKGWAC
jgi:hypothetical protein